jgi:4-carboxymuconolactone decarboxylase
MTRLPEIDEADLDESGRVLHDRLAAFNAGLGRALLGVPLGATSGPANAFLHDPQLGGLVLELGAYVNGRSALAPRTKEIVIMTVVAHWRTEFEWWAHSRMAAGHDIDPPLIDAIAAGAVADLPAEERVLRDLTQQLLATGRVDDGTYQAAQALVGDAELVKVVSLCGYYTMVSFLLNAFEVAVPAGEPSRWRPPA